MPNLTEAEKAKIEADKAAKKLEDEKNTPKRVRVICESDTLGHLLLKKGDVTDDKEYVALLKVKGQQKVEEVK
jgi:hypothetical protein